MQATAAAEAMRSTLSHVEAALETRESELHDMWRAVQQQAAGLQSGVQSTAELLQPDTNLLVSLLIWACAVADAHNSVQGRCQPPVYCSIWMLPVATLFSFHSCVCDLYFAMASETRCQCSGCLQQLFC